MEALLAELRILESKINALNEKPNRVYKNIVVHQMDAPDYKQTLQFEKLHFLITLTFDPKVSVNLDEYGQKRRLDEVINSLNGYEYYCCFEKHKSGIVHSHILIQADYIHDLEEILYRNRKYITKSNFLRPAIDIKSVKRTVNDLKRTYDYIILDKADHPIFKHLKFNI